MAAEVIHLGPIGQGLVMKLVNNMLAQVGRIAVIEALVLGAKAGLDPQTMLDVIGRSTGNSVAFQYTAPRVVSRDFDGIRMDITYKDLELQTALAKSLDVPLFLATICQQIYQMGRRAGRRRWSRNREDLRADDGRGGDFYLTRREQNGPSFCRISAPFADSGGWSASNSR